MRVFGPIAGILFTAGFVKGTLSDYVLSGQVGNLAVTLLLSAVQVLMLGLLGGCRVLRQNKKGREPSTSTPQANLRSKKKAA